MLKTVDEQLFELIIEKGFVYNEKLSYECNIGMKNYLIYEHPSNTIFIKHNYEYVLRSFDENNRLITAIKDNHDIYDFMENLESHEPPKSKLAPVLKLIKRKGK